MNKLFENWRKNITEAAVPHSARHVVKKMMKTGKSAKEALKSLTHDLSDEEAERWLERHKDEMDSAKQDLEELKEVYGGEEDHSGRLLDLAGEVAVLASRADDKMRDVLLNLQGELEAIASKMRY